LVTRYTLARAGGDQLDYLAACYEADHFGVIYTPEREDACSYVTIEKAAEVAKALQRLHGVDVTIVSIND
jgi:hypothetical protein